MSGANGANDDGANDGANDGGAGGGDAGFAVLRILTDGGYLHPRETMAISKTCTYMRRWAWNGLVTRYAAGTGTGFGTGTGLFDRYSLMYSQFVKRSKFYKTSGFIVRDTSSTVGVQSTATPAGASMFVDDD